LEHGEERVDGRWIIFSPRKTAENFFLFRPIFSHSPSARQQTNNHMTWDLWLL
jgi:hypothetical protein